jgi:hypothetical protein
MGMAEIKAVIDADTHWIGWDDIREVLGNAKAGRRSKYEIAAIESAIYLTVKELKPMTVRQLFYQLVSRKVIDKTEAEYKQTVVRLLSNMRRAGQIPFSWIADGTRWQRKPNTHRNLSSALDEMHRYYRRQLWAEQPNYVEIWLEKDALSGVLYDVTSEYDVPLMVTRGYPSLSFLSNAAEQIAEIGKPTHLFYFGDFDPSGVDIPKKVERDLREFSGDADIAFEVVAVKPWQIDAYGLQTRPTKTTDSRAKNFGSESVEVDAIHPDQLRTIARNCIEQLIDPKILEGTRLVESAERDSLKEFIAGWGGVYGQ